MLGGPDIITWLLMALGGALAVGNMAALARPNAPPSNQSAGVGGSEAVAGRVTQPNVPPPGAETVRTDEAEADTGAARVGRSVVMIVVGLVIVVWAIASLVGG